MELKNDLKNKISAKILSKCKTKYFVIIGLIILGALFTIFFKMYNNKNDNNFAITKSDVVTYNVKIHIDFTENLIFSKYNVKFSIGNNTKTLEHGQNQDMDFYLEKGTYTLTFINTEDSSIRSETTIDVSSNMEVGYKISCHYDKITVENLYTDKDDKIYDDQIKLKNDKSEFVSKNYEDVIKSLKEMGFTNIIEKPLYDIVLGWTKEGEVNDVTINGTNTYKRGDIFNKNAEIIVSYHLKEADKPKSESITNITKNEISNDVNTETEKSNPTDSNVIAYNYYTTNSNDVAKKGNAGKFAYVKKGKAYNIYWLIDFDDNCVYNFSEGNGDDSYEKIKIESGNLNDGLELSYNDSENAWVRFIHFKYVNQPHQLVIVDNDYFEYEFETTSLKDVLYLMESKRMYEP